MNQTLTIVLPMHNRERQLRLAVLDILELQQPGIPSLEVVIVDDGSFDETYETACEVSRTYPQVTALRQSVRRGMGAALDLVRHRMSVDIVVVHDGITDVDASQLKALLRTFPVGSADDTEVPMRETAIVDSVGSRRLSSFRSLHENMEHAHRAAVGFQWMRLQKPIVPRRSVASAPSSAPVVSNSLPTLPAGTLATR